MIVAKEYVFADGKYTIIRNTDGTSMKALRYGEDWQNLIGDNLIAAMLDKIDEFEDKVFELEAIKDSYQKLSLTLLMAGKELP